MKTTERGTVRSLSVVQVLRNCGLHIALFIVTFELRQIEVGTELRFTQIGVPPHRFDGHSRGWIETYNRHGLMHGCMISL